MGAAGLGGGLPSVAKAGHGHGLMLRRRGEIKGVLVDLTMCVGCRLCEYACRESNGIETGPIESYDDQSVFAQERRPTPDAMTVVNAFEVEGLESPVYAKVNCLHCNEPACVSACIVGALTKEPCGAVVYDAWKCIGCRYCMVACPFQVPTYEYRDALTPRVRKCEFCTDRTREGKLPACVEACPRQALVYGKRDELLALAHERIANNPEQYTDHVYGEHEVGGTSWMYLSPVPFERAGFLTLGDAPPGQLTEAIQHGVFKHWIAPIALYGTLATAAYVTRTRRAAQVSGLDHSSKNHPHQPGVPLLHKLVPLSVNGRVQARAGLLTPSGQIVVIDDEHDAGTWEADATAHETDHGLRDVHHDANQVSYDGQAGHHEAHAAPVAQPLLTPGFIALACVVAVGALAAIYRFVVGIGATTHLDQQHPWGLWIAMDVGSGIALAGGGFVTAALVHIFHRERYHAIARSALVTALLGYTFYVPGLLADLGRWYNLWHPTLPSMWQVNSVLFEVGICVMIYLNVQYAELMPILCERVMGENKRFPRLARWAGVAHKWLERVMPALLILGVTLSCFHQSSLGNLMVIAPYKLHALWWSPLSPLMFLLSAAMVGFPMVIFTMLFASWSVRRKPEMDVLGPLSLYAPVFLSLYLALKIGDMAWRGTWVYLLDGSMLGVMWVIELAIGVVLPMVMILLPGAGVRKSPMKLAVACLLVILGVVLNRLDVFVIAYHPPYAQKAYFPSAVEFMVSAGLVAALMLVYRVMVNTLPILSPTTVQPAHSQAVKDV